LEFMFLNRRKRWIRARCICLWSHCGGVLVNSRYHSIWHWPSHAVDRERQGISGIREKFSMSQKDINRSMALFG
jgi:hypothetical protein